MWGMWCLASKNIFLILTNRHLVLMNLLLFVLDISSCICIYLFRQRMHIVMRMWIFRCLPQNGVMHCHFRDNPTPKKSRWSVQPFSLVENVINILAFPSYPLHNLRSGMHQIHNLHEVKSWHRVGWPKIAVLTLCHTSRQLVSHTITAPLWTSFML